MRVILCMYFVLYFFEEATQKRNGDGKYDTFNTLCEKYFYLCAILDLWGGGAVSARVLLLFLIFYRIPSNFSMVRLNLNIVRDTTTQ